MNRGYITIATGDRKYYQMAVNLLHSYRNHTKVDLPFAILCDEENEYTKEFDQVIIMHHSFKSYMDKLMLYQYIPFDETIFLDSDMLILSDPSEMWDDFSMSDDVSCYGDVLSLNAPNGWFDVSKCDKYKDKLNYNVDFHGGVYFLRKTLRCKETFELAINIVNNYSDYGFKYFEKPADEPVIALAMVIEGMKPCQKNMPGLFWPSYRQRIKVNKKGQVIVDRKLRKIVFLHFGTINICRCEYVFLSMIENKKYSGKSFSKKELRNAYEIAKRQTFKFQLRQDILHMGGAVLRKLLPDRINRKIIGYLKK